MDDQTRRAAREQSHGARSRNRWQRELKRFADALQTIQVSHSVSPAEAEEYPGAC